MITDSFSGSIVASSLLFTLLLFAAVEDVRRRRVSNAVNAVIWGAGLLAQLLTHGAAAVPGALGAGILMIGILWVPWVKGFFGAADVKLAAGVAVWLGLGALPRYMVATALAGGVVAAVAYLCSQPQARASIRRNIFASIMLRELPAVAAGSVTAGRVSVPYAVGIALGGALTIIMPLVAIG